MIEICGCVQGKSNTGANLLFALEGLVSPVIPPALSDLQKSKGITSTLVTSSSQLRAVLIFCLLINWSHLLLFLCAGIGCSATD